jgi:hypothetical protein
VRNERGMLGSGRGYGRPMVERPDGARSLLYYFASLLPEILFQPFFFPRP